MTNPVRNISSIIKVNGGTGPVVSCKTSSEIPKGRIHEVMELVMKARVDAPVKVGDILIKDVAGTGVDIIATNVMPKA